MIDIVLLVVIGGSALFGLIKGLVGTLVSTTAWLLAGWAAFQFGGDMASWLAEGAVPTATQLFGGYALSFIVVMLAVVLIGALARSMAKSAGLSGLDRMLGMVLGLARGAFLACVLVLVMGFTPMPRELSWRQSLVLPLLQPGAGWMRSRLPQWSVPQMDFRNLPPTGDNGAVGDLPVPLLEEAASQLIDTAKDSLSAPGPAGSGSVAQVTAGKDPVDISSTRRDPANIESAQGRDPADIESASSESSKQRSHGQPRPKSQ